ncbi:MAG TPA: hypothetical protein VGD30_16990, partial [Telluria sp.]
MPVLILKIPSNPIQHSCAVSDYNYGATLIRAGMCVHIFSIEFAIWRGRWRRPCVKYRFNSYTSRGLTAACRLYIQNEGLRENFWEDRANEDAK